RHTRSKRDWSSDVCSYDLEYALDVVHETAKFLGTGVANILNIFNPEVVVICGGVTLAGEKLFAPLRGEVKRRAFKPAVDACRIEIGRASCRERVGQWVGGG